MNRLKVLYVGMVGTPTIASCREVGQALQNYLDGQVEGITVRRIARHLELCRRCGMDAATYQQIKDGLRRSSGGLDRSTVSRLRDFAGDLSRHSF